MLVDVQILKLQIIITDDAWTARVCVLWGKALTWAMNWIIFTNILRGVSRGTTLREPFGKSADTMLIRRL